MTLHPTHPDDADMERSGAPLLLDDPPPPPPATDDPCRGPAPRRRTYTAGLSGFFSQFSQRREAPGD